MEFSSKLPSTHGVLSVLGGHTNTERGYLKILKQKLLAEQKAVPEIAGLEIEISKADEHPLVFM